MNILVTGGLGFIGSNFCRHLINAHSEAKVTNIDKIGIGANLGNLRDLETERRYRFVRGNICDSELLQRLVTSADIIFNFAAETHVDRSIGAPYDFLESNIVGTFRLLEATRKHRKDVRFIQVSTDEVYGEILQGTFTEEGTLKPSNPYAASKASADMLVQAYFKTYDLNASITRCTNNYGPYQSPEKLIPKTIIRALKNLKIPVYGTGMNIRDWIYVQDHCEALDLVSTEGLPGQIYNISAGYEVSNMDVIMKILKCLGKDRDSITFVEDRPGHDKRYSLDSSKTRKELGWKPRHPFKKALEKTVRWYVRNQSWWSMQVNEQALDSMPWKQKGNESTLETRS